jgi:hypothetical protein
MFDTVRPMKTFASVKFAHRSKADLLRPRGLRNEQSSRARTLVSWLRILLEEWMSVCVYSEFVLYCV